MMIMVEQQFPVTIGCSVTIVGVAYRGFVQVNGHEVSSETERNKTGWP